MESIGKLEVTNKMGFGVGLGWEKLAESGLNTDFGLVVGWGKKLIQVYADPGGISQILSAPNVSKMAICESFEFERLCTCLPAAGRGCGHPLTAKKHSAPTQTNGGRDLHHEQKQ